MLTASFAWAKDATASAVCFAWLHDVPDTTSLPLPPGMKLKVR